MKLAKFTVSGYRNFDEPVTIDFTKVHDYHFNTECIDNGIITKMGIYGINGSGKTNLGYALFDIVALLTDKHESKDSFESGVFLNLDSKTKAAVFQYVFQKDNDTFFFEYQKKSKDILLREKFSINGKIIYDYDYVKHAFTEYNGNALFGEGLNFDYLGNNLSALRYIANNSAQKEDSPVRCIMNFVSNMLSFRSLHKNTFTGLETGPTMIEDWIINEGLTEDFNDFINNVCSINIRLTEASLPDKNKILIEKHKEGALMFQQVSSSGMKAAELFYFWMKRFKKVSLLYMDEFDAYYHFELSEKLISILKNYTNMQAIFTTHNTALLSNSILRPDCYLILDKGTLVSYIDRAEGREIREGHNLEKIYRNGGLDV